MDFLASDGSVWDEDEFVPPEGTSICLCCGGSHGNCGPVESVEHSGSSTAGGGSALPIYTVDQIAARLNRTDAGGAIRFNVRSGDTLTFSVSSISAAGQTLAREAIAVWSEITGIKFREIFSGAQIRFTDTATGASTGVSSVGNTITQSTVMVSKQWLANYGTTLDSYSFQTYLHEVGHALGLTHAGNYNGSANFATDALFQNDSWASTVMSYFSEGQSPYYAALGYSYQYLTTPTVADALAVQGLYGAPDPVRTGDTVYGVGNTSGRPEYDIAYATSGFTIFDGGGIDTLDYSSVQANQLIDLHAESASNIGGHIGNMSIGRGVVIENAIAGSGDDVLIANAAANRLTGGAGADTFRWLSYADGSPDAVDTITDFGNGRDRIDITALHADRVVVAQHQSGGSITSIVQAYGAGGSQLQINAIGAVTMGDILGGNRGSLLTYDGQNQLSSEIGYDAAGLVSYQNLYSGGLMRQQIGYDTTITQAAAPLADGEQAASPVAGQMIWRNSYDAAGRMAEQEGFNAAGVRTIDILHDGYGGVVSSRYDGNGGLDARQSFDSAGRLIYDLYETTHGYVVTGNAGAQVLPGGPGATTYLFDRADSSTATAYDVIANFNSGVDHIDLSQIAHGDVVVQNHGNGWTSIFFASAQLGDIAVHGSVAADDLLLGATAHLTMM